VGSDTSWASVVPGRYHSVAIKTDGTLWVWGNNRDSQLGLGDTTDRSNPEQVGSDSAWAFVAAGNGHTVAVKTDGTLWAWGDNDDGQLGLGDTTDRSNPEQVGNDTAWAFVAVGFSYTIAIKTDGTLWAWGSNFWGHLGLGDMDTRYSPTQVGSDSDWAFVAAGLSCHTVAIKTDGTLWAWGNNIYGQLGLGDAGSGTERLSPEQVGSDTAWAFVTAGGNHTVAVKTEGTLWVWGGNDVGQLGDGTAWQAQPIHIALNLHSTATSGLSPGKKRR
jgi:alpha-tubulin suppressor-like RCC1 family protein